MNEVPQTSTSQKIWLWPHSSLQHTPKPLPWSLPPRQSGSYKSNAAPKAYSFWHSPLPSTSSHPRTPTGTLLIGWSPILRSWWECLSSCPSSFSFRWWWTSCRSLLCLIQRPNCTCLRFICCGMYGPDHPEFSCVFVPWEVARIFSGKGSCL